MLHPTIIDKNGLKALGVPYCVGYLRQLEQQGRFPRRRYLSPVKPVWLRDEVESWLAKRVGPREAKPP